jgi:cell division protein FtsA
MTMRYLAGIDVGSSKICAAVGEMTPEGLFKILGVTSENCNSLEKSVITEVGSTAKSIRNCIDRLETKIQIPISEVFLSIPGGLCDLSNTKDGVIYSSDNRYITERDIDSLLDSAKNTSRTYDKGVISNKYLESIEYAGLKLKGIVIQTSAQGSVLLTKDELASCVALVDVGAETIDLGIYKGGNICYTKLIPMGGNNITSDISKCLKISIQDAEKIKVHYGDVKLLPQYEQDEIELRSAYKDLHNITRSILVEIIKARVEEMINFVYNELIASSLYKDIEQVIITGGGIANYKSIGELSGRVLGKTVKTPMELLEGDVNPSFITALGTINRIFEEDSSKGNFDLREDSTKTGVDVETKEEEKVSGTKKGNKFVLKIRELIEEFF